MPFLHLRSSRSLYSLRQLYGLRPFSSFNWEASDDWITRNGIRSDQEILEEAVDGVEPSATVIDGKLMAHKIKQEVAQEVLNIKNIRGEVPGLGILLVGARRDSTTHVRIKKRNCEDVGITFSQRNLFENSHEEEVLEHVEVLNRDPSIHGIVVQLPLPKHINEERVLTAIRIEKDVDGFHPLNVGTLAMQGRRPLCVSCSSRACLEILMRSGVHICGKNIVVIGRSNTEAMLIAMLLQRHHATVTVVHNYTQNPAAITRTADVVITAVGIPHLVRGDWIKHGAFVIDVGLNYIHDPHSKKGYRLVGDVCFKEVSSIASAITPVPGGIGPMSIAMLLSNTLESAKNRFGLIK